MQDDINLHQQIASFMRQKRQAMGLTVREFSILIFQTEKKSGYISKIENEKKHITIDTFNFFLKKLNCSITINEH